MTITINGREYAVEVEAVKDDGPVYKLTGKKGAVYYTLRNRPRPSMLFLVGAKALSPGAMRNVWLSDQSGTLRQVR